VKNERSCADRGIRSGCPRAVVVRGQRDMRHGHTIAHARLARCQHSRRVGTTIFRVRYTGGAWTKIAILAPKWLRRVSTFLHLPFTTHRCILIIQTASACPPPARAGGERFTSDRKNLLTRPRSSKCEISSHPECRFCWKGAFGR
jgi:hypothetical protein